MRDDYWCEIYDPLGGDNIPSKIIDDIKNLLDKLKIEHYLKLKINKVQQQSNLSDSCGWFCIKFLLQRYNKIPFHMATSFNKIKQNEQDISELKTKYNKFGFI